MADATANSNEFYFTPERREFITVIVTSLVVSSAALAFAWLLAQFALAPIFCKDSTAGLCADPYGFSFNMFLVVATLASIGWFAKARIFRPALVALPPVVILWAFPEAVEGIYAQNTFLFSVYSVLLFTFTHAVFYWLVRIRSFFAVLVVWLLLTFLLRWLLVS